MKWKIPVARLILCGVTLSGADMLQAGQKVEKERKAEKVENDENEYMRNMQKDLNSKVMKRDFSPGDRKSIDAALEQPIKNNTPQQVHRGELEQAGKSADDEPSEPVVEQIRGSRMPKQKD